MLVRNRLDDAAVIKDPLKSRWFIVGVCNLRLEGQISPIPAFVNKVLLAYSQVPFYLYLSLAAFMLP